MARIVKAACATLHILLLCAATAGTAYNAWDVRHGIEAPECNLQLREATWVTSLLESCMYANATIATLVFVCLAGQDEGDTTLAGVFFCFALLFFSGSNIAWGVTCGYHYNTTDQECGTELRERAMFVCIAHWLGIIAGGVCMLVGGLTGAHMQLEKPRGDDSNGV